MRTGQFANKGYATEPHWTARSSAHPPQYTMRRRTFQSHEDAFSAAELLGKLEVASLRRQYGARTTPSCLYLAIGSADSTIELKLALKRYITVNCFVCLPSVFVSLPASGPSPPAPPSHSFGHRDWPRACRVDSADISVATGLDTLVFDCYCAEFRAACSRFLFCMNPSRHIASNELQQGQ